MRKIATFDIFRVLFCTFCSVTNLTLTAGENAEGQILNFYSEISTFLKF